MQQGSRWIGENVAKFTALWFVALLLAALLIPGEARFPIPRSILGIVSLPLTLVVFVFVAAFVAFVALVLFGPILALWVAIYLVVFVDDVALAVTCLYGFLVRPWPAKGSPAPTARDGHTA